VKFCHRLGMDYVSCSPFRVPIARLAAAQAVVEEAAAARGVGKGASRRGGKPAAPRKLRNVTSPNGAGRRKVRRRGRPAKARVR
jgi:pyruvate,orthophosphate dikinase